MQILVPWDRVSHGDLVLANEARLAGLKPQGPACLCLPTPGMTSIQYCALLFHVYAGAQTQIPMPSQGFTG